MESLKVVNLSNEKVEDLTLDESVFGYPLKRHLIYEAVNDYRAAGRSGTRQTKTRAEVSGSGRKLWKQKKTGRARVGSIRSSIWRHGGTVFGPHPHDYESSLPKRMRKNAIRSVLSSKLRGDKVRVVWMQGPQGFGRCLRRPSRRHSPIRIRARAKSSRTRRSTTSATRSTRRSHAAR